MQSTCYSNLLQYLLAARYIGSIGRQHGKLIDTRFCFHPTRKGTYVFPSFSAVFFIIENLRRIAVARQLHGTRRERENKNTHASSYVTEDGPLNRIVSEPSWFFRGRDISLRVSMR